MKVLLRAAFGLAAVVLAGCANFKVVKDFANETTEMTGAVKQEIQQVARLCNETADVRVLLNETRPNPGTSAAALKQSCKLTGDATVAFQEVTADTLDLYAKTLLAMIEDNNFDVRSSIEATSRKAGALKSADGAPSVNAAKLGAVTQVLALLGDVVVQAQREEGIRRLVKAGPDLVANARILRDFFVRESGQSDYDGWLTTTSALSAGTSAALAAGGPVAKEEPIRAAEMRRQLQTTQAALDARLAANGGKVPKQIVAAIDEWIALVPVFQQDALKPEPRNLLDRIKDFRKKAIDAREAVVAGF